MVKLEYFTQDDFEQLMHWITNEELLMNWCGSTFQYPLTQEDLTWYIKDANDPEQSEVLIYKVVDTQLGQAIGHISLGSIDRKNSSARISRVLIGSKKVRGKGYCQDMIHAILRIGFEELNLHRISLGVYDRNKAAIRCYRRSGFRRDGVLRDKSKVGDTYWSLVEMSVLEHEWHEIDLRTENIK